MTLLTEQRSFTPVGSVAMADARWKIGIGFPPEGSRVVSETWSYVTGPEVHLITWETTKKNTAARPVLAAAPGAIFGRDPRACPRLEWERRESTTDTPVHESLLATITHTDGATVDVHALFHPALLTLEGSTEMTMLIGPERHRTLFLPVGDMDNVDLAELFARLRTSVYIHG